MAKLKVQMNGLAPSDLPRDTIVTSFYLDTDPTGITDLDYDALATDSAGIFANTWRTPTEVVNRWEARVYNMADALPRPPRSIKRAAVVNGVPTGGPREIAICLSMYSERNLPRQRGRLFLGPIPGSDIMLRPDEGMLQRVMAVGAAIANLGGVDVDWVIHSPTDGTFRKVTNYWCDDEWDTQRSRGLKSTRRLTAATSE